MHKKSTSFAKDFLKIFLNNYEKLWLKNKLLCFFEKYGNKYRKVGNCFRLPYVKAYVSVELGFIKIVTVTFPTVKYV